MTQVVFSKTRRIYYSNELSKTSDESPGSSSILHQDGSPNYGVGKLPGSIHNWHHIPMNHYGLYMTTAELQDLLENSDSFTPISAKAVIGHTVPLSQYPGATGTLQLSFNNTIYSLIYHLRANDMVAVMNDFATIADFYNFCRTYDGNRYKASTTQQRVELPKPDLRFKFPRPDYIDAISGSANNSAGYAREITVVKGMNDGVPVATITSYLGRTTDQYKSFSEYNTYTADMPLTEEDLRVGYQPEFLQDDENLNALYPGENIDEHTIAPKPSELYTVKNGEQLFNQLWTNRDIRALFKNSNFHYADALYLFMNLFPECRGPYTNFRRNTTLDRLIDTPDNYAGSASGTDTAQLNATIMAENILHNLTGLTYASLWTDTLSHMFIRGNEILDPTGSLIPHTFQATVNWSVVINVVMPMPKPIGANPVPWKWIKVYRTAQKVITPGATLADDTVSMRVKYTKGNPHCSQTDASLHSLPIYCLPYDVSKSTGLGEASKIPSQLGSQGPTFTSTLPSFAESEKTRWGPNLSHVISTTFLTDGGSGGPPSKRTRSKTAAATSQASSKKQKTAPSIGE